jgi:hypothetical protein
LRAGAMTGSSSLIEHLRVEVERQIEVVAELRD